MKKTIAWIGIFLIFLVSTLPIVHAAEIYLTYDANGNLVTGDGFYREYNSLNQLWKIRNGSNSSSTLLQEFTYDPIEERVLTKKTYNSTGSLLETVVYVDKSFVQVINSSGRFNTTYVYHEGLQVAQVNPDGTKNFMQLDHKGSVVAVTNSSGSIIENNTYTGFGEIISGGNKSRYDYEGKETDSITGEIDYHFRSYDPDLGIFLRPDDNIQNPFNPQDLNHFTFERNNPYKYTDPDGKDAWLVIDPDGANGNGHVALIIGNDEDGYKVYSQGAVEPESFETYSKSNVPGGVYISEKAHSTKAEAMHELNDYMDVPDGTYKDVVHYKTDRITDKKMDKVANDEKKAYEDGTKRYNKLSANCADFTIEVLQTGGNINVKTKKVNIPNQFAKNNVYSQQAPKQNIFKKTYNKITRVFKSKK